LEHESPVTLAGILTGLRIRPSRKGDLWASGYLEDMRGTVELLVFPQALGQLQSVLKPETALLVKGRVRHEENARPKVVVQEAAPLETAVNGAKPELRIRLNLAEAGEALVEELEKLLEAHPGENPLVLELTRPGDFLVRLRPRKPQGVNADAELVERLRALCGPDSVTLGRQGTGGKLQG
jgi:DNA polymerase III subunit alpha